MCLETEYLIKRCHEWQKNKMSTKLEGEMYNNGLAFTCRKQEDCNTTEIKIVKDKDRWNKSWRVKPNSNFYFLKIYFVLLGWIKRSCFTRPTEPPQTTMIQAVLFLVYMVLAANAQSCSYSNLCSDHTMCRYQVRKTTLTLSLMHHWVRVINNDVMATSQWGGQDWGSDNILAGRGSGWACSNDGDVIREGKQLNRLAEDANWFTINLTRSHSKGKQNKANFTLQQTTKPRGEAEV
jgi:hypothetical protein